MKLKNDLDPTNIQQMSLNPTKIQQMSKKPNRNPTNETKTQQKSNNSSEKPNKNPTKKPNIDGRCWVLGSSKNQTKNPTFCWICWILVGFFLLGCRPQALSAFLALHDNFSRNFSGNIFGHHPDKCCGYLYQHLTDNLFG
jgi:hypothetical protein